MMAGSARVVGIGMALALTAASAAAQQAVTLPARDTPLREPMTNVWAVGTDEGRDWEMFAGVRGVAFDRQDNVYVLDQQNTRVVVFDRAGRYLRQFGKKGQGPGELSLPLQVAVTSDGSVVVSDLGNRAFIVFTAAGEYVRNVPYGDDVGMLAITGGGLYADPRGGVVARSNVRIQPDNPDQENVTTIFRQPLTGTGAASSLFRLTLPKPQVQSTPVSGGAQRVMVRSMDPIFGARPSFGVLPDGGLVVHHETAYNVKVMDGNGRAVRTLRRNIQPRRVTKQDQEAWQERTREAQASGGGPMVIAMTQGSGGNNVSFGAAGSAGGGAGGPTPPVVRMNIEDMQWAEVMSVVTNLRTDPTGRIWIQRRHADGRDAGPIDLVSSDGRYIGTLPAQALPDAVSASGLAAYVVRDDVGIERVVVRRLPAAWR
ncbi:MAG TPA: 6-bladed beta-propeller [Longimicrobiales bacterium]|nr:6-bladed beta-propeller [Longimicrobiales bacterium]